MTCVVVCIRERKGNGLLRRFGNKTYFIIFHETGKIRAVSSVGHLSSIQPVESKKGVFGVNVQCDIFLFYSTVRQGISIGTYLTGSIRYAQDRSHFVLVRCFDIKKNGPIL